MTRLAAVIFDMDGVLVDSEPLWQDAEIEVFADVGVSLTRDLCRQTMGLRIDEAVAHWFARHPWEGTPLEAVAERVVARVVGLIGERAEPLPGVHAAVAEVGRRGLRCALASSSPRVLIDAVLDRLELGAAFEAVHSAEDEQHGKPHPAIYLTTADRLGVEPATCLAVEDSVNGVISAKAARMTCVAVPERAARHDPRFGVADVVLDDLCTLSDALDRF